MFWNYFIAPTLCFPPPSILLLPSNSSNTPSMEEMHNTPPKYEQSKLIQKLLVDLNEEDLEKAGHGNKRKAWTEEEDQVLRNSYQNERKQWGQIAELLPGRNDKMCYSRYQRIKNQTKNKWKKVDDEKLCELVEKLGENWKQICYHFPKRNTKQIKQHYLNFLKPGLRKDQWTIHEDMKLIHLLNIHGTNWRTLEENMEGRSQNQIKNRYFGRLKKLAEKKQFQQNQRNLAQREV